MDLSVIIPAYNEEERLPEMLLDLQSFLNEYEGTYEIIVVNDGSKDNTVGVVRDFEKKWDHIKLINNQENAGKGAVVRQGMLKSSGELRIFADADGATPFREITKLLEASKKGSDVVIASRAMKSSNVKTNWFLRFRGRVFNFLVNRILGLKLTDLQCGFKLFNKESAQIIFSNQKIDGFAFDAEVLYKAKKNGYKISEVPIEWNSKSGSKVHPILDPIKMLVEVIKIRYFSFLN